MLCNVLKRRNHVAVLLYRDAGRWEGRIVPELEIRGTRPGKQVDVPMETLDNGIEYGLDFGVILGMEHLCISSQDITQAFRAHGIWTLEDLDSKANEANAAVASLTRIFYGAVVKATRAALGG